MLYLIMAQRKPYNPNTAYGRKKMREEYQAHFQSLPKEEQERINSDHTLWYLGIIVVLALIAYLVGGSQGLMNWFS
jgi:hypothetical protein